MKDVVATSHNWARTLGLLGMGRGTLSKKELYALSKKYLMIESEGERKFAEMAAMTDDEQIKSMLVEISETKREHHKKARKFIDMLERTHDEVVKEI